MPFFWGVVHTVNSGVDEGGSYVQHEKVARILENFVKSFKFVKIFKLNKNIYYNP